MNERRDIDERDIDQLLEALSDLQISELYGMLLGEVIELRRLRRSMNSPSQKRATGRDKS